MLKTILFGSLAGAAQTQSVTRLVGDTNDPEASTFILAHKVELTFHASGLSANAAGLTLKVAICDAHDKVIQNKEIPVQADDRAQWTTTVDAPSDKTGFYRVRAELSNGTKLEALGTRVEGFLTYAVVPDPALRLDFGMEGSRFGLDNCLHGNFGPWRDRIFACMGARWTCTDIPGGWRECEPTHAGQFDPQPLIAEAQAMPPVVETWRTYPIPTLMLAPAWAVKPGTLKYYSGVLTLEGEKAWVVYCQKAARAFVALHPDMPQRIYLVTRIPCSPWGFDGTDEELIRIYELAYPAIHDADPRAVVAGPSRNNMNQTEVDRTTALFEKGLAKYIDAYTVLPDCNAGDKPETDPELVTHLRAIRSALQKHSAKELPRLGMAQRTRFNEKEDPSWDLGQARALLRQNLIVLGEGFDFNIGTYLTDFRSWGGWERFGYGYFYNLSPWPSLKFPDVEQVPAKISPKPIVPAYAVQSMLLDGTRSLGPIAGLDGTAMGYAFSRGQGAVLALWDYGDKRRTLNLPVGEGQVMTYDWMGQTEKYSDKGTIEVEIGPEPLYVIGVSAKAAKRLVQLRE